MIKSAETSESASRTGIAWSHSTAAKPARLSSGRPLPSLSPHQLLKVLQLIHDNLADDLPVLRMAEAAGMSEFHFARQFRLATGQSPHQFLLLTRTEHARDLLVGSQRSVLDISLDCGFKDASHFSRVFRTIVGATPRQYRSMNHR